MNTVHIRATSLYAPAAQEIAAHWRNHHHSLLDMHFKRVGLLGTVDWLEGAALITAQLPTNPSAPEEALLALANMAIVGTQYAALQIAEGSITSAVSAWPAGGAVGLLTGSQLGRNAHPLVRLGAIIVVGAVGAVVSSKVRAEIPIYRLIPQVDGNLAWERIPLGMAAPSKLALA
jgi:hypothetical protein